VNVKNDFLLKIGTEARKSRVSYWNDKNIVSARITKTPEWTDAGLWFRTAGCAYDALGGCIMCDYSNGPQTTPEQMISYVEQGLKQIPQDCRVLLVSPSGSMFDDNEVPRTALVGILHILRNSPYQKIAFETRAETITVDIIRICKTVLGKRFYGLYVGLESASPFILKYCLNKQLQLSAIENAINICNNNDIFITFNVIVGAPFLSTQEIIETTVKTVSWAFDKGASRCDLFPIHVKLSTPLAVLYDEGIYSPPSLWELVEVLNRLGESMWPQIGLSWYTTNDAYNIISSPTTCPVCFHDVLKYLEGFAHTNEAAFIKKINNIVCSCKENWKHDAGDLSLPDRVIAGYSVLAKKIFGDEWRDKHIVSISNLIKSDWDNGIGLYAL